MLGLAEPPDRPPAPSARKPQDAVGDHLAPLRGLRILVVDDDAMIAMLLADLLELMGHEICAIASTESEAVAAALKYRPDLMITDAQLGGGSGVSAVDAIHLIQAVPHIFITADVRRVKAVRPDAIVVQKPFGEPDITQAIARALTAS